METLGSFNFARLIFLRSLAAIYPAAFLVALKQSPALLGQNGLVPVPQFIQQVPFQSAMNLKASPAISIEPRSNMHLIICGSTGSCGSCLFRCRRRTMRLLPEDTPFGF